MVDCFDGSTLGAEEGASNPSRPPSKGGSAASGTGRSAQLALPSELQVNRITTELRGV